MTIKDFWNNAFIASLHRMSPIEAKASADEALKLCLEHWDTKRFEWAPIHQHWHEQDVLGYAPITPSDQ